MADSYANNQNPTEIDAPQVAANFPAVEGIELLSPAFINPGGVPGTFANGTSGPTPQLTLGKRSALRRRNSLIEPRELRQRPVKPHRMDYLS